MKLWNSILSLTLGAGMIWGCVPPGEGEDSAETSGDPIADDSGDEEGGDEDGEEGPTGTGALAVSFDPAMPPSESLQILESSLTTVPQSEIGTALSSAGTIAIGLLDSGYQDEECDGNGYPIAKEGETASEGSDSLSTGDPSFTQRHFYCLVKVGTSPEAMLGSITINKGVLCALEAEGAIDETKSGQDQTVNLKIDTNCFSREFVIGMQNEGGGDGDEGNGSGNDNMNLDEVLSAGAFDIGVKYEKLTDDPNWDIRITSQMDNTTVYLFRNTETILSGAMMERTEDGEFGSGYVYSIENNGIIRFENRLFPVAGSDFDGTKHIRLLVEGTFADGTTAFEDVTRYEGVSASLTGPHGAHFNSMRGSADTGYRVLGYACGHQGSSLGNDCFDFAAYEKIVDACLEGGDCTDEAPIGIDASSFHFIFPGTDMTQYTRMGQFLQEVELPLRYGHVDTVDVPVNLREADVTVDRQTKYVCKRDLTFSDGTQVNGANCGGPFVASNAANAAAICASARSHEIEGIPGKKCCATGSSQLRALVAESLNGEFTATASCDD